MDVAVVVDDVAIGHGDAVFGEQQGSMAITLEVARSEMITPLPSWPPDFRREMACLSVISIKLAGLNFYFPFIIF